MTYGSSFVFTLFTNSKELAKQADLAGVDRVGLDLEVLGKKQRQDPLKSWISDHSIADLPAIRNVLADAKLFARTNPLNPNSKQEVDMLVQQGVQVLMLPMFRQVWEVEQWIDLVAGRATTSLLLETGSAADNIEDIVRVDGIDEIHIGLNDLHLDLGLSNHFQILVLPLIEKLSSCIRAAGIPFGFGGVARTMDSTLPLSPDLVYAQYPRLNADRALISRVYFLPDHRPVDLVEELEKSRAALDSWSLKTDQELETARIQLAEQIKQLADGRGGRSRLLG